MVPAILQVSHWVVIFNMDESKEHSEKEFYVENGLRYIVPYFTTYSGR